ncbi:hypothetical protein RI367_003257 [Sorochytrium milnesiophthora]
MVMLLHSDSSLTTSLSSSPLPTAATAAATTAAAAATVSAKSASLLSAAAHTMPNKSNNKRDTTAATSDYDSAEDTGNDSDSAAWSASSPSLSACSVMSASASALASSSSALSSAASSSSVRSSLKRRPAATPQSVKWSDLPSNSSSPDAASSPAHSASSPVPVPLGTLFLYDPSRYGTSSSSNASPHSLSSSPTSIVPYFERLSMSGNFDAKISLDFEKIHDPHWRSCPAGTLDFAYLRPNEVDRIRAVVEKVERGRASAAPASVETAAQWDAEVQQVQQEVYAIVRRREQIDDEDACYWLRFEGDPDDADLDDSTEIDDDDDDDDDDEDEEEEEYSFTESEREFMDDFHHSHSSGSDGSDRRHSSGQDSTELDDDHPLHFNIDDDDDDDDDDQDMSAAPILPQVSAYLPEIPPPSKSIAIPWYQDPSRILAALEGHSSDEFLLPAGTAASQPMRPRV